MDHLTPEERKLAEDLIAVKRAEAERNPLTNFHACAEPCGGLWFDENWALHECKARPKQHEFMAAKEFIVASNAGNRFGKTTAMVVWSAIQHSPIDLLPDSLKQYKRAKSKVVTGRYMLPSEEALEDTVLPVFRRWMPKQLLRGGAWEKAYRKAPGNTIHFADGGKLAFHTYKQDAAMLAGWSGDYVLWDEPPPESHWREGGPIRVLDRDGCHRFGMTPVNMKGGGIGWIKRRIFDRAKPDHPDHNPRIRVVKASIHDNPNYSPEAVEQILSEYPEEERRAREYGDFVNFGGMVYPDWQRHEVDAPDHERIKRQDIIVGIDPGYHRAAFVWVAFDEENNGLVFAEAYVERGIVLDYVKTIRQMNERWGVKEPLYVLDPYHGHKHGNTDGQTVKDELGRQGIWTLQPRVLDKDAIVYGGVSQVWRRMAEGGFAVSRECRGLSGEAEEYRLEDRPDGVFRVIKELDDGMDAMRYAFTHRPWYPNREEAANYYRWTPGEAPPFEMLTARPDEAHLI